MPEIAEEELHIQDWRELQRFIYDVTLHLQANRMKTPEEHDWMFQRAYKLYVKHNVEKDLFGNGD